MTNTDKLSTHNCQLSNSANLLQTQIHPHDAFSMFSSIVFVELQMLYRLLCLYHALATFCFVLYQP